MRIHLSILLLCSVAVLGCSDEQAAAPASPVWSRPPLPVRILPQRPVADPDVILDQSLASDTEGWWSLSVGESGVRFAPAGESPGVTVSGDALVVPRGPISLIRFLELPIGDHEVSAVIKAAEGGEQGLECTQLHCAELQDLDAGDDLRTILQMRTIEQGGRSMPLLQALTIRLQIERDRPRARWDSPPDEAGYARARYRVLTRATRKLYAVFLPATDQPVQARSFQVRKVARFRTATVASRSQSGAVPVKLSRDIRPAVWVGKGDSLDLPVTVPAGAARLTLALGQDPEAAFRDTVDYQISLVIDDGPPLAATSGTLTRGRGGTHFTPIELRFAEVVTRDVAARFHLRLDGEAGLFVAQPMLRAAPRPSSTAGPSSTQGVGGSSPDVARPFNLLFVSLDTLRADHLGSYGYERDTSPFLDRQAARSIRFENYFAVAPYTLPTHATMFTGRFPARHGAIAESDRLDTQALPYLPLILRERGYSTAAFTGGGFLSEVFGFSDGFDQFSTKDPIKPDRALKNQPPAWGLGLDEVERWIADHGTAPWFAFLHTFMIHDYDPPESDFAPFDTRPAVTEGRDHKDYLRHRNWVLDPPSAGDLEHCENLYDATIRTTDRTLESFFHALEEDGHLDHTIVVVTSDHGEEFWEHGSLRHSVTVYDEMLRVPLWILVPGQPSRVVREPTSQADLFPTLLDLLDAAIPEDLDGQSMVSHALGSKPGPHRTPLYASIDNRMSRRSALRVGNRKMIDNRTEHTVVRTSTDTELYDMLDDPGEQNDLSMSEPAWTRRMQEQIEALELVFRRGSIAGASAEMTPEVRQHLIELGYLGN